MTGRSGFGFARIDGLEARLRRYVCGVIVMVTLVLAAVLAGPGGADAQIITTEQQKYFDEWLKTAKRAESAIEAGRASTLALEAVRADIVRYRDDFENARTQNSARIATLQSQLEALGPAPEEGASEPEELAQLRSNLNDQVTTLRVPVVVSSQAYSRANGIIREIDRIIRERQRQALLKRTESPLEPALWPEAWSSMRETAADLANETRINWVNQTRARLLRATLPQALFYLGIGLMLLLRGRRWAEQAGAYMRSFASSGLGVWGFLISLGRILLPLAGVYIIIQGISVSNVLGFRGERVLSSLPYWTALVFGFQWLGERIYPRLEVNNVFGVSAQIRPAARRNVLWLGVVLTLYDMVDLFEQIETITPDTRAVITLPVILIGALVVLRLRMLGVWEARERAVEGAEPVRGSGVIWIGPGKLFRLSAGLVALLTPVLAVAGYSAMAEAILFPFIKTLGLYGLLMVLQIFLRDIFVWISGQDTEAAENSVVPILLGFALALGALPIMALFWGARTSDLTEILDRFLQGVQVGNNRISPADFLAFAVVFVIGYTLTRMFQSALKNSLLPRTSLDQGGQNAVVSGTGYVGVFLAALVAVSTAGIDLSSLAIVAGALSVGIGFGLQNIVSNFVSGIILLIERPVAEGDWIEVSGNMGIVRDISVRSTRIETFDRSDVILPNSDLVSGTVTNYTRGNTIGRLILPVGVAYGSDTQEVERILREIAEAHPMVLANPAPFIVFKEFGADSLNFEVRAILRDINWVMSVRSEMNHQVYARFAEAGIEIPFAQRDVWLRNPETLHPKAPKGSMSGDAGRPMPREMQLPGDDDGEGPDEH